MSVRNWLFPLLGLLVGAAGAIAIWWGAPLLSRSMIAVSDDWMLNDQGPQLGIRSTETEIVLIQIGEATALRLKSKPDAETDGKLYEHLLDAGASVIMDNRLLACGTTETFATEVAPFAKALTRHPQAKGRLAREISFNVQVDRALVEPLLPFVKHNAINLRTPKSTLLHGRVYPLQGHDFFSLDETAALWLVRRHRGQPAVTESEAKKLLRNSKLFHEWTAVKPGMARLLGGDANDPAAPGQREPRRAYDLNGVKVHWLPFDTSYIPVSPGGFWIDYSVKHEAYPRIEYGDVVENDFDHDLVNGKIVIIGLSPEFIPMADRFITPQRFQQASEDEVLAAAVQTLLDRRTLRVIPLWCSVLLTLAGTVTVSTAVGIRKVWVAALLAIGAFVAYYVIAVAAYRHCYFADLVWAPSVMMVSAATAVGARLLGEVRSRRRITDMFGRYVPRGIVDQLVRRPELQQVMLTGTKHAVTVMFADIRGFTSYSEKHPPEVVLERLNELLEVMVDCTFAEQGTVDKFIGDAILVLFNAPTEQPDHIERALRTAWAIQQKLAAHESGLAVGIGIHTGEAVVGNVGTAKRMEYTAIGSTVNLASRLCDQAGAGEIICSHVVAESGDKAFAFDELAPIRVKGVASEVDVRRVAKPVTEDEN